MFPDVLASDTVFSFAPMTVQINGEERHVEPGVSIARLLEELGIRAARVVVELNRDVVAREAFATTTLKEGDKIEIVHFVGGG
ncbi:MAG TPA: sulfur carrier protein ThiS [Candidatus Acidoferrales bacterium]|nr:sulfur carrier protein ThiS [Candidatus Acidoferrales bacterium]